MFVPEDELTDSNRYATLFLAIIDTAHESFEYINAGHNPPLLFRSSAGDSPSAEPIDHSGLPLGMFPESVYEHWQLTFRQGDVLVLYTDGVTEAQNSAGEEFGEWRLREAVTSVLALSAAEIGSVVKQRLRDFVGQNPPFDDITLVVVKMDRSIRRKG